MKKGVIFLTAALAFTLCACDKAGEAPSFSLGGQTLSSASGRTDTGAVSEIKSKDPTDSNPIISNVFCADPTSVEYDGRLYIYGTCDQQQFDAVGADGKNTYEKIKSLVMLSTDDMVNYTYHGRIDVEEICPWIIASWAPSIVSRVEDDGLTHFYLYFSNSGWGTGVITSTSPTGPWSDPLGHSLIDGNTPGLDGCKSPFDPGVCIDDNGTGWLSFGGGTDSARIVKLGSDMISLDSEISKIPSPCHFEASELNYINGTYVYTYNNDWDKHILKWKIDTASAPPSCSMSYMTTETPLDPESWVYRDYYFKNPGEQGLEYSNNHTHLQKYQGKYYLFYHSLFPQQSFGTSGGFRSLCVNEAQVDESTVTIERVSATKSGVSQIKNLDPYQPVQAETIAACSNISYRQSDEGMTLLCGSGDGKAAWICVRGADLGENVKYFAAKVKGKGRIDVFIGNTEGEPAAFLEFDCTDWSTVYNKFNSKLGGVNDIYFVISDGVEFDSWQVT
ncbi:MAG: family 43 glycosylhydrolase [Oscillospiraceae bacterium]|nr:family 43 glycosylhydrolase [Oscillospiraceae bacterium]